MSLVKTMQPRHLGQLEEKCGLGLDLLRCLESDLLENIAAPVADATILDGAAVVQMLNPGTTRTFQEYGERMFVPYISAELEKSNRIDLVFDVYLPANVKASNRQKRGKDTRKRVAPSNCERTSFESIRTKPNC